MSFAGGRRFADCSTSGRDGPAAAGSMRDRACSTGACRFCEATERCRGCCSRVRNGGLASESKTGWKPLRVLLDDIWAARLMRDWLIMYEIDDDKCEVTVLDIRHRANAYRLR